MCQRIKNRMEITLGKLKLSKVLEKPWTYLMVDFITKLLVVAGKDVILVVSGLPEPRLSTLCLLVAV